jgi:hypothetical protein
MDLQCSFLDLTPFDNASLPSTAELGAVITNLSPACDAGSILEKICTEETQDMYSLAVQPLPPTASVKCDSLILAH